ncbi:hypothetical protein DFH06DRAFT_564033 [Mycena polygramma]|nr:hypothetical protein DFH06DRAFT_564033 [Mycena polygramma]
MPFLLFSPGSREAAAAAAAAARNGDRAAGLTMSNGFGTMGSPSGLSLAMNHSRPRSRSRSHSRPRSRSLTRAPSPANQAPPNSSSASPLPSMSTSMTIPNPHHELRGQLHDLLRDPPMSSSLPNMTHSHFPSSPLSREFRHGAGSTTQPVSSRDRSVPITPSGKPRDNYLHPPMLSQSRIPSPFHTSTPLSDPASVQRPPLHRNTSNASQIDESQRSDRERQGADRAAARTPPRMVAETRLTPMLRPQSHNISIPLSSSATQAASPVHAMSRPQIPHKNSSLRLPTPPSSSDAMQRAQVHSTPLPSPSSNAPQQAAQPMPRAQAHAAPFSTTPPSGSNARPRTKPSSPSSSQPRTPPGPINSTAPASFPAGQSNRAANGAHSSRHAPEDTYTSTTTERVRRSDDARGGYGAGTRGTSKRMLAPAMAINPNMIST